MSVGKVSLHLNFPFKLTMLWIFFFKNILKITESMNYGMDLIITKVVKIKLIKLFNLIVNYKNVSPLLFGMM